LPVELGEVEDREDVVEEQGEGTLAQFVVEQRSTGEVVGLVTAFGASLRDQHAHLAFFFGERHQGQGWPLEALALFLDYVFTVFDLTKLYGQLSELNLPLLASGLDDLFVEEARLVEHDFYDGRHWDSLILAIYRDRWLAADNTLRSRIHTNYGRQSHA
jgi:RimJ/RimL family protein N-acetyltransferase